MKNQKANSTIRTILKCMVPILTLPLLGCTAGTGNDAPAATVIKNDIPATVDKNNISNDIPTPTVIRNTISCPTSEVTEEMYARATKFAEPDLRRLASVMKRAEAGENITVGVIGGSITQGCLASKPENCYASILNKWWTETFPKSKITFINAGIGGTDSFLGVHRCDEQLLAYNPDFVIVEFSVNDSDSPFYKTSYDNLVRRIMKQENMPAVMLLFMTMEDGTSAVNQHSLVGFSYQLPMLSYKNAVLDEISAGTFTWKDISPDNIHPNDKGHAICGELIWKYLNSVYERLDTIEGEPEVFNFSPATKEVYMNATILENTDITPNENEGFDNTVAEWSIYDKGWSTDVGGHLKFTVEASRIGLVYHKTTKPEWGTAEIIVDGETVASINAYDKDTWGSYGTTEAIFSDKEVKTHTIEINVPQNEGQSCFDIYGLMISE